MSQSSKIKNIPPARVHVLQDGNPQKDAKFVLYWMSRSFRTHWNYSLEYAVGMSEKRGLPLVVFTQLDSKQQDATERQVVFLLEGLQAVQQGLKERKIQLVFRIGALSDTLTELLEGASELVTDFAYLPRHRERLAQVIGSTNLPVTAVEGNVIVPVETASDKQEYAARTIRPKLQEKYDAYLEKPVSSALKFSSLDLAFSSTDFSEPATIIEQLQFKENAPLAAPSFRGGQQAARDQLDQFLHHQLTEYDEQRQSPTEPAVSYLSMYLAAGMIAPAYVVRRLQYYDQSENTESFLEELLVRRELARNFVFFAPSHDSLTALPDWAQETLAAHKDDPRENVYTRAELEQGATKDEAWNACMRQLRERGYLHNHLRMYWGKQILAWTNTPQYALSTLLYLNNKYFLDGNDANSYANALWVFGLHDRAWQENEVFGKVRLMNRSGLNRKIAVNQLISNQ